MTTTDEEIMQTKSDDAAIIAIEIANKNGIVGGPGAMLAMGILKALRAERARTQATAAAAWVAGRDAAAEATKPKYPRPCDCSGCNCHNSGDAENVGAFDGRLDAYGAIRALAPPAEFAAPEDARDAEVVKTGKDPEWIARASASIAAMVAEWYAGQARGDQDISADLIARRLGRFAPEANAEIIRLRDQLAERDALLRDVAASLELAEQPSALLGRIDALLSQTEGE